MVRHTNPDAKVSTPDYRADADLAEVDEGDRIEFTTRTNRSNGVPLPNGKTLTVDDVTVEDREQTRMVEVDPAWFADTDGPFACPDPDAVESKSVPRDVTVRHVEVVAIDDGYRYTLRQEGDDVVRVSSCKQADYVDQNERGEWNAVARSNVSHGYITSFTHTVAVTDGGTDEDDGPTATDLSVGDRVEVEATPMSKDEPGRVTGDVADATVHTMNGDEVGRTVKIDGDDGNRYVRKGTGTLSVVDADGFHVTIAWDSTLRREPATDGGDDIIVAGDDGVILSDAEDDDTGHTVDPDDEGVELLTDGGTPTCEACDGDELTPLPDHDESDNEFVCDWCGAFVDEDGKLPRTDDKRCPKCHGPVAYGILSDPREGIRGYLCVGTCDDHRIVRPEDEPAEA